MDRQTEQQQVARNGRVVLGKIKNKHIQKNREISLFFWICYNASIYSAAIPIMQLRYQQLIRTGNRRSNIAAYRHTKVPEQSLHLFLHLTDDCSST